MVDSFFMCLYLSLSLSIYIYVCVCIGTAQTEWWLGLSVKVLEGFTAVFCLLDMQHFSFAFIFAHVAN